jgi:hypothetical protein
MTCADAKKGEIINGYKCLGHSKDGVWGQFKIDNSQEWSDQQRQEWKQQNQQRQQQQAKDDEEKREKSLKAEERDRQYREILAQLSLHPDDRADLIRRGFTNEQIELSGFKSVEQYQNLQSRFSNLLPGLTSDGRKLITTNAGYLCPVREADDLIVAFQIRLRALSSGEGNRYRWLSSKAHNTLHLYPDDSLKGELPLAIFKPEGKPEGIALAEGTGAKPFLVSQRLNKIVIGAAGGQWLSSPKTFRNSLDRLAQEIGKIKPITLYPDAGDIQNRLVMNRWKQVATLLQKWGWSVRFAWWGQVDKSHPDIDELTNYKLIRYIRPKKFFAISPTQQNNKAKTEEKPSQSSKPQSSESDFNQKSWDMWRASHLFTPNTPIINSRFFHTELPEAQTLLGIRSGLGTGKTYWLINTLIDNLSDKGFLSIGYRNSLLLQFCSKVKGWYHLQQDLKGQQDEILIRDENSKIACCIDSLIHFRPEDFDGRVIILDEIESIVNHLLRSNTAVSYFRERIKELFVEFLNRADRIICLDGHLTNTTIEYLQSLQVNPKKLITVENQYKGNRGEVEFYLGSEDSEGQLRVNDYSPIFQAITNNQKCLAIGSDSQTQIESLDKILTEQGRKTLRLDSTTSNKSWVPDFLDNPSAYIHLHQIEVLLYSPSAEAGLNIDIQDYFSDIYFLFYGVITTKPQLQMLGRIRDSGAKLHVYCKKIGLSSESVSKSSCPEKLEQEFKNYFLNCALASFNGVDKQDLALDFALKLVNFSADKHFEHETKLIALENHERANLRACLREALEHSGYKVQDVTSEKSDISELKGCSNEIKESRASAIYSANDISTEEANEKASQFGITADEKAEIALRRLKDRLPGIENATYIERIPVTPPQPTVETSNGEPPHLADNPNEDESTKDNTKVDEPATIDSDAAQSPSIEYKEVEKPVLTSDFIRKVMFDKKALISQVETHWLLSHPDIAKELQQNKWLKRFKIFTDPDKPDWSKKMNLTNYKSQWLKINCLLEMGIMHFLQPNVYWNQETPEVIDFWNKGKDPKFARALRMTAGKSKPCEYLGRHLNSLGIKTKSTYDKKKKLRTYKIDSEWLKNPARNAIYEAAGRKFEKFLDKDRAVVDWSVLQKAETQSKQGIEVGSPSTNFIYKNQEGDPITPLSQIATEAPSTAAVVPTDTQFCLKALERLETPDHPSISTQEELVTLFEELEARGEKCGEHLPNDFWMRAAVAVVCITKSFEKLQTQSGQCVEMGSPSTNFIYKNQEGDPLSVEMENGLEKGLRLLKEAINHGAETIQAVLSRWSLQKRRSTLLELQRESEEVFHHLILIAPELQVFKIRSYSPL